MVKHRGQSLFGEYFPVIPEADEGSTIKGEMLFH
jgi:hypothetical protein